ncbi:NmrA family NAD(P)-binding protein [Salipiger sp. P9]|uniref:NmrA family NAD(P)-binding protein n=1 Tax=Salipiger pentaromativorans TaxID=2943193 RepID=UPI0021576A09|nr:NmrA family NAD(P)-binding protein [Salipiger pentaromativorans]MCR8547569.1 NmrA family NAD(P)-binding protein [Salipiger pentaromativorans]
MYAITGITGKVGGAMARALLDGGERVRAVARNAQKLQPWAARGAELAIARMQDADALAEAFSGAQGVFILPPSNFDPAPGFQEAAEVVAAVSAALDRARPKRVVCLSSVGAQAVQTNNLSQRTLMEEALGRLDLPVAFLRPGWFMENFRGDIVSARDRGVIDSFLQPADRAIPMAATADVGELAAEMIRETWSGTRIVELEHEIRLAPVDVARIMSAHLGRPVAVREVPRDRWEDIFRASGMVNPLPRMRMLDGINEGWIDFESPPDKTVKGPTTLDTVLRRLFEDFT